MVSKQPLQTSIWNYVKDLLHEHDCVIVPGFGGFVCNRESSRIDQVSHVITPPSRKVVFNQNLKSNDGLLAGYLVQQQGITYKEAIGFIEEHVQQTLETLQEQKQLIIDLFGNFRLNADANYVFLPDKQNNYLTSSYGLSLIQASPVASRNIKNGKVKVFRELKTPQKARKTRKNLWPSVMAGVLVLVLSVNGYIFFNDHSITDLRLGGENTMSITSWFDSLFSKNDSAEPVSPIVEPTPETAYNEQPVPPAPAPMEEVIDTAVFDSAVLQPEETGAEKAAIIPDENNVIDKEQEAYTSLKAFASNFASMRGTITFPQRPVEESVAEESVTTVSVPEENNTREVTPAPLMPKPAHLSTTGIEQGYYVIGGVFCKERNARRFIKQLLEAGFPKAELLVNADINCKRVSYQRFSSRREAEQLCKQIQQQSNPDAWVLAAE